MSFKYLVSTKEGVKFLLYLELQSSEAIQFLFRQDTLQIALPVVSPSIRLLEYYLLICHACSIPNPLSLKIFEFFTLCCHQTFNKLSGASYKTIFPTMSYHLYFHFSSAPLACSCLLPSSFFFYSLLFFAALLPSPLPAYSSFLNYVSFPCNMFSHWRHTCATDIFFILFSFPSHFQHLNCIIYLSLVPRLCRCIYYSLCVGSWRNGQSNDVLKILCLCSKYFSRSVFQSILNPATAGPRRVGTPGRLIIWRPFKLIIWLLLKRIFFFFLYSNVPFQASGCTGTSSCPSPATSSLCFLVSFFPKFSCHSILGLPLPHAPQLLFPILAEVSNCYPS